MERLKVDDETPIENRLISKSLEGAQKKVEGFHFDQRKNVVQYDDVMNRHRKAIYSMRKEVLRTEDISKRIKLLIEEESALIAESPKKHTDEFEDLIREIYPFDEAVLDRLFSSESSKFGDVLLTEAKELYQSREVAFTPEIMRKIERDIYLQILDNLWMQHLENMDHMREGIHWISVGQRDPLVEYRRQGQVLFAELQESLRHDVVTALFHAQPVDSDRVLSAPADTELTRAARYSVANANQILEAEEFQETDFTPHKEEQVEKKQVSEKRKKAHKAERQRKAKARRKK